MYLYATVLKYMFHVSVLYLSRFVRKYFFLLLQSKVMQYLYSYLTTFPHGLALSNHIGVKHLKQSFTD